MRWFVILLIIAGSVASAQETVDLHQGDYPIVVSENCVVDSGGFQPCIVQIVYNPKTKKAVVGHLDAMDTFVDGTEGMISTALREVGPLSDLQVIIAGGGRTLEPDDDVVTTSERARVLETFKKHGFTDAQVTARWLPPRTAGGLVFSTKSGKAELTVSNGNYTRTLKKARIEKFDYVKPETPDVRPETCNEIIIRKVMKVLRQP